MNYKSINLMCKGKGKIHEGNGSGYTGCGRKIENNLYTRWELTDDAMTCKLCLRKNVER